MEIKKISSRSYVLTYKFPDWDLNLQLIEGDKYNFIIDTGVGAGSVAPLTEIAARNKKPIIVINTHHHWDHVWGNCAFPGSFIISHPLCRAKADAEWEELSVKFKEYKTGETAKKLADITFEKELYFPDDGILLFHTPGHTEDSISVYDERDKVLNAGDNIGDTMEEIVPNLYSEKEDYIKTLQLYNNLGFKMCVSGHNVVQGSDIADRIFAELK